MLNLMASSIKNPAYLKKALQQDFSKEMQLFLTLKGTKDIKSVRSVYAKTLYKLTFMLSDMVFEPCQYAPQAPVLFICTSEELVKPVQGYIRDEKCPVPMTLRYLRLRSGHSSFVWYRKDGQPGGFVTDVYSLQGGEPMELTSSATMTVEAMQDYFCNVLYVWLFSLGL